MSGLIYLTFDDGPDPVSTPAVLDVLAKHGAIATFFLVGKKAVAHPELTQRLMAEGHAIGNHSWDHRYRNFFRGTQALKDWIQRAENGLRKLGADPIGFRPPAGVLTPHVKRAARELDLPIVLWNERFYDAVWPWTKSRAIRSAKKLTGGSIVLLHDRQSPARLNEFCSTLDTYLACLKARGLQFGALNKQNRG